MALTLSRAEERIDYESLKLDTGDSSGSKNKDLSTLECWSNAVRLVQPAMEPYQVHTKRTVIAAILGEHSKFESYVFWLGANEESRCPHVLWGLWIIGASSGMLVLAQLIPLSLIWLSLLMLPLPVVSVCVMNQQLVQKVWAEFEYKVLSIFHVLLITSMCFLLGDSRCCFCLCFGPSLACSTLVDAYPAKFRSMFSRRFFAAKAVVFICWKSILILGLPTQSSAVLTLGSVVIGAQPFTFTTVITLLLFCYRHLRTSIWKPDTFVLLKSAVSSGKIEVLVENDAESGTVRIKRADRPSAAVRVSIYDNQFAGGRLAGKLDESG
eukprot:gnl/TRDRNA2_/TRDRNA2_206317_c0_seq1.p1 gnl/TRDRNA2_/TRDRNA2_206317_c0~~gnl/TRDRNA2_/TRDRNA2_206317_c0_seq1.p1  ORF type:complete len:324 (-),score=34.35 gnl/TRDRNA2_/TRDRNA2_206317_c0_seq1:98-1069(-)